MGRRWSGIAVVLLLVWTLAWTPLQVAAAVGAAQAVRGAEPAIVLDPLSGPPTTTVMVRGTGFPGGQSVVIRFHRTKVLTVAAGGSGSFVASFAVPAAALPG